MKDHFDRETAIRFLTSLEANDLRYWRDKAFDIIKKHYFPYVTYSLNVFLPLTHLCRNNCAYCGFRKEISEVEKPFMSLNEIEKKLLFAAKNPETAEVLITLGEKPEDKYPTAKQWLIDRGYDSTVDYVYSVAEKVLNHGLLPHINVGTLTKTEMKKLREVSASMGLMLESISERLMLPGMPHEHSPDKNPKKRLETITNAGKLQIPYTTGLLIGIGEEPYEIIDSLYAIKKQWLDYHHIQEVIIQNFQPQQGTRMVNIKPPDISFFEKVIIAARLILPVDISIQVPPNLTKGYNGRLLHSGASDWGGISTITPDYINIDHSWPELKDLQSQTEKEGFVLRKRLPIYPSYCNLDWCSSRVYDILIDKWSKKTEGYY